MLTDDMLQGVLIGFVLALGLGVLGQYLRWTRNRIGAFFEPQRITLQTHKTPFQVFCGCLLAAAALVVLILAVAYLMQKVP